MIVIQEKVVSLALFHNKFVCHIDKCKGGCCVEGDFGAPLEEAEIAFLSDHLEHIKPFLTKEGIETLEREGVSTWYAENEEFGTPLIDGKACAFVTFTPEGVAQCGIEKAHQAGVISFKKPISCHLYPIRVESNEATGFEALNYDQWDICNPACKKGGALNVKVYEFCKDAIIRKYGSEFYEEMEAIDELYIKD